jgi:hypothetical protein
MTLGKRNRTAGHAWERHLAQIFNVLGYPHVVTTRSESKSRDDDKVDLINKNERRNGQFVFNVQAKNTAGHLPYAKLLAEMPQEEGIVNIIAHKQTKRVNSRFVTIGQYVTMTLDDFITLITLAARSTALTPEIIAFYGTITKQVVRDPKTRDSETILPQSGSIPEC